MQVEFRYLLLMDDERGKAQEASDRSEKQLRCVHVQLHVNAGVCVYTYIYIY